MKKMNTVKPLFILLAFLLIFVFGCRKETIFDTQSTTLRFSSDTIYLDTVFTTIGSSTRILKVYNPTDENLLINRIYLGKGPSSYYRMNVNGTSSKSITDVELRANDSIYIFVEVTADVLGANSLLYTDSILFETGSVRQDVDLVTLAKDAYFHYPNRLLVINQPEPNPRIEIPFSDLPCNTTWADDKPHVVYGYVRVDSLCTLNILAGAEVHFHSNSGLWVYRGGKVLIDEAEQGNYNNPVIIQGDRLEPSYENIPGQWGGLLSGIFIQSGSTGNIINNTIIKNATNAIRVDSTNDVNPNLQMKNVQILNNSRVGLFGGYANIDAQNVIIANCGVHLFYGLGGSYTFRHSTFANYWRSSSRNTTSIALLNFFEDGVGNRYLRAINNAYFGNSIIYGNGLNEIGLGIDQGAAFNYKFNAALLRIDEEPDGGQYDVTDPTFFTNCILNTSPRFVDELNNNYALDSISPALDAGNSNDANLVPFDIKGNSRTVDPDLGAIER
jgi:hypothetical protein